MPNVLESDGVNDELQMAVGGLSAFDSGTYVLLVNRQQNDVSGTIIAPHTAGGTGSGLRASHSQFNDTALVGGGGAPSNVAGVGAAGVWWTYFWRKAAGSATPRLSALNRSTGAWIHGNGHAAISDGDAPGAGGSIRLAIGQFTGRGNYRYAAGMVFANTVKWATNITGDLAIEAIDWTAYQNWLDQVPDAAWRFNTSTPVPDDTGNGADETGRVGMTLVNDPDLVFDFSLAGGQQKTVIDDVGLTDTVAMSATRTRTHSDDVGLTDTLTTSAIRTREDTDPVGITDTIEVITTRHREIIDSVGVSDTAITSGADQFVAIDTIGITDDVRVLRHRLAEITDSIGIGDDTSKTWVRTRVITDEIGVSDSTTLTAVRTRTVADGLTLTDVIKSMLTGPLTTLRLRISGREPANHISGREPLNDISGHESVTKLSGEEP